MIAAFAVLIVKKNKSAGGTLPVALHTLKMADGWGYDVLVNNKVFIHQDCIPAIPSFKRFNSESDALLVANRVADKIKHGHKPIFVIDQIRCGRQGG